MRKNNHIDRFLEGYKQFHHEHFKDQDSFFKDLVAYGQKPKVLMVACSDSRVDPALLLKCAPGDLFMIRNVANLVPPYERDGTYHGTSAALEFGVCVLQVDHIILFGHSPCGGVQTLLEPMAPSEGTSFLRKWMEIAQPARDALGPKEAHNAFSKQVHLCGQKSLINSLKNLMTFPWITQRIQENLLSLHAWNFNMEKGVLEIYDPTTQNFKESPL